MKISTANLQTRARRASIPSRHAPYWVSIGQRGRCIGYRRAHDRQPGTWFGRIYVDGRWVQTRLGSTDDRDTADGVQVLTLLQAKEKAMAWFPSARSQAEGGTRHRGQYKVSDALADYFVTRRREGMKETNIRRALCAANAHIEPFLGHVTVERLTIGRIKKWMGDLATLPARKRSRRGADIAYRGKAETEDERRARRDTVNRILTVLKAALNVAAEDGRVPVASAFAWREVKPFKNTTTSRTLFLDAEQQQRFVAACDADFAQLVRAGLYGGARYGELRQVQVCDFDQKAGTLHIPSHVAKNGKERHIYLDSEGKRFFSALSAHRPSSEPLLLRASRRKIPGGRVADGLKPWQPSEQARSMRQACVRAGFTPFPFYTLRHSCAARWLEAGLSMKVVADQLGNSVAICDRHYGHIAKAHLARVMREMPPLGLDVEHLRAASPQRRPN